MSDSTRRKRKSGAGRRLTGRRSTMKRTSRKGAGALRPPFPAIMVALDGSEFATRALAVARAVALGIGTRHLVLVHVHERTEVTPNAPVVDPVWQDDRAAEMQLDLRGLAAKTAGETGLDVEAITLRGPVADTLVRYAEQRPKDLLVLATHGRSGIRRAFLGSVAERVAHAATTPLLVVPSAALVPSARSGPPFRRVLIPLDPITDGAAALQLARRLGSAGKTTHTLQAVLHPTIIVNPYPAAAGAVIDQADLARRTASAISHLKSVARWSRAAGEIVDVRVANSEHVAKSILGAATEIGADLLVLPVHPRTAVSRVLLGSVTDSLTRSATMPILMFRAPTPRAKRQRAAAKG